MRHVLVLGALLLAGCSAIYDGHNLHGKHADDPCYKRASTPRLLAFSSEQKLQIDEVAVDAASADFDGDRKSDLAVLTATSVHVLTGSSGLLTPAGQRVVGATPQRIVAADVDGDRRPDLIVLDAGDNSLGVYFGHGDGTFDDPRVMQSIASPHDVAVADLDGDGRADLAVAGNDNGQLGIHFQVGARAFAPLTTPAVTMPLTRHIAAADLDGDGQIDLVTASGSRVEVFRNAGGGRFPSGDVYNADSMLYSGALVVADLIGDGRLDLVDVHGNSGAGLAVFTPTTPGTFATSPTNVPITGGTIGMAVCDFDGDGLLDLALAMSNVHPQVLKNDGGLAFQAIPLGTGNFTTAIVVGDFDGDGLPDAASVDSQDISLFLNRP